MSPGDMAVCGSIVQLAGAQRVSLQEGISASRRPQRYFRLGGELFLACDGYQHAATAACARGDIHRLERNGGMATKKAASGASAAGNGAGITCICINNMGLPQQHMAA